VQSPEFKVQHLKKEKEKKIMKKKEEIQVPETTSFPRVVLFPG
jgi:glutaredoxin